MAELHSFLLILAVIYAVECLVWVPLGALAFTTWRGRRWRLRQPSLLAGNAQGGFLLAHPLPPLGVVACARQLPLSLSPEGVCAWDPACLHGTRRALHPGHWAPFTAVLNVTALGRKVLINGQPFLRTGSESYAAFLADLIRQVHGLRPDQRARAIHAAFAGQLDTDRLTARLKEVQQRAQPLQWLANALFASVFLVVPLLTWQFGLRRILWFAVAGVLAQTVAAAVLYHRAHKALLPAAPEERFAWVLTMLLAAPTAMRAHDLLVRRALETFHPLALARVLASPTEFRHLVHQVLLDLRHPLQPLALARPPEAWAAVEWSLAAWRKTVEEFVRRAGLSPEQLLAPPTPSEPDHVSYCPRCLTQYIVLQGVCQECGGLPLARLPQSEGLSSRGRQSPTRAR